MEIPDGAGSRLAMFSARFDGGQVEQKFREVQKILQAHNYDTLMVEADAGEDFGMLTMQYLSQLDEERGILLAVCTEHYGEMTSSKYSSFWELKYAYDRDLAIMPLKVSKVYPPRPPFGADHPYDKKGTARGFVKSAMPSSTVYINCLDEPGENLLAARDIAALIAAKLRKGKANATATRGTPVEVAAPVAMTSHVGYPAQAKRPVRGMRSFLWADCWKRCFYHAGVGSFDDDTLWKEVERQFRASEFNASSTLKALKNFAPPGRPYPAEARQFVMQESKRVMRCKGNIQEATKAAEPGGLEELVILLLFAVDEELHMPFCSQVPAEAWRQLEAARWEKLRAADFSWCFQTDSQGAAGAAFLLAALARCSELQELNMDKCTHVPAEAWRQLEAARWEKLTKADFEGCFQTDSQGAGAAFLLAALARCSELEELNMQYCYEVPAEAWRQLEAARWEKLTKANFDRCFEDGSQDAAGAAFLLAALARCSELQELNMNCTHVPAEAWRQLEDARWEKLRRADFFGCFSLSEFAEGAAGLLAALARCSELEELNMQYCYEVPAEAWRQLEAARWEKLTKANFDRCFSLSEFAEGAAVLLAALARCSELQDLRSASYLPWRTTASSTSLNSPSPSPSFGAAAV
ncbi:unnamed protein product [Symbiodinium natans]|uniref:TIR domain-containing protein n=1 Tax=Symbiodinium natans TaxID=878477 RepID=A0A812MC36_9DINO|nr:unnamed protein product [Symbiodinium natans]